jgi:cycloartenol synthase
MCFSNYEWINVFEKKKADIDPTPIHRGMKLIINSQMEDGDFPQQVISVALLSFHRFIYYFYSLIYDKFITN